MELFRNSGTPVYTRYTQSVYWLPTYRKIYYGLINY
jgi:hypothetical protein